jgi:hypothetical protein
VQYPAALDDAISLRGASNNSETTLSVDLTSGATTATVVSTSTFPSAGVITLDGELVTYTGKTSTTFTGLGRGAFGSSAAAHLTGVAVYGHPVAAHHNALRDALIALETMVGIKGAAVASAAAIVPTGSCFHVTGTTTITSITATNVPAGAILTIIFDGALTFTDGSNLKLAGNFVTTADDTITLRYDGTNFYEMSRSVN